MRLRPRVWVVLLLTGFGAGLLALQSSGGQFFGGGGGQYNGGNSSGCYPQSDEKAEFSWSRLQYTPVARGFGGGFGGGYGGYGGYGGGSWSRDYPKADRQFLLAMKRLTRINGRSTEQVVDLNSNDTSDRNRKLIPGFTQCKSKTGPSQMPKPNACANFC